MPPRKLNITKQELLDTSQRRITHYFPKTDKWKHDFNFKVQMRLKKRILPLIPPTQHVETITLDSSDDDFDNSQALQSQVVKSVRKVKKPKKEKRIRRKIQLEASTSTDNNVSSDTENTELCENVSELVEADYFHNDFTFNEESELTQSQNEERSNNLIAEIDETIEKLLSQKSGDNIIASQELETLDEDFSNSQISQSQILCVNKPNTLTNSPEKPKALILQKNTRDLFVVEDNSEESREEHNSTSSNSNDFDAKDTKEAEIEDPIANKENSPDNNSVDITIASEESSKTNSVEIGIDIVNIDTDKSNILNKTIIKEYITQNKTEKTRDTMEELNHILQNIENSIDILTDTDTAHYKMYYLRKVVKNVVRNFDMLRLLRDVEIETLINFLKMNTKYQFFCFKLFTRLPKWYNMYKLIETIKLDMNQNEVTEMYTCLQENNFIVTDYTKESVSSLLHQMERIALKRVQKNFKIKGNKYTTKEAIISSLIAYCNSQTTLSSNCRSDQLLMKLICVEMGPCAKLDNNFYTTLSRIHLLNSFTNPDLAKISDLYFYLSQIEKSEVILPKYDVEISSIGSIFPRRQDFLQFSKAAEYKNQFLQKLERKDWTCMKDICDQAFHELYNILNNTTFQAYSVLQKRFSAGHKYASILSEASKHLTKQYTHEVETWLRLLIHQTEFCQKRKGLWYDRLAMIRTVYRKDIDEAAIIILKGLGDTNVTESGRREILNRGVNLLKRKTLKIEKELRIQLRSKVSKSLEKNYSIRNIQGKQQPGNQGKCYYRENNGDQITFYSVEEYSIKYYITELDFTHGIHCEGSLFSTLLSVLFWDIIYDEYIPGTFLNNLQSHPLDFYTTDFYLNRMESIDNRLEEIGQLWTIDHLERTIRDNYNEHKDERCGISGRLFETGEDLVTVAQCIGRVGLATVLQKMVLDIGDMCAGLPDLFVWNTVTYQCKFVEVKSEKDVLSMKQICWLNFLKSAGLDAEVCHVLSSINSSKVPASKRATVE